MDRDFCVLAGGDLILGENSEYYFQSLDSVWQQADLRFAQLEVPYCDNAPELADLNRELKNLQPLKGRFEFVTLAGNHIYDAGEKGVKDTLDWLDRHGIDRVGAGMNLEEARTPLIFEKSGIRFGILNYNCVGGAIQFAGSNKAGSNPMEIISCYDLEQVANPGGPPETVYTFPKWKALEQMGREVRKVKEQCDVVMVSFHKGLVHKPVKLADYERIVSYAVIECGADVVFGGHSHIVHGIEVYKGKTIYHGLANLITWVPSLSPNWRRSNGTKTDVFDPEAWAQTRMDRFGFVPLTDYPTYPFHPEAVYCFLAKLIVREKRIAETRLIPMLVNKEGAPVIVGQKDGGQEVLDYIEKVTKAAGLNAGFVWDGNEVVIL